MYETAYINERGGNYKEIDPNQHEIPKALKGNESIRFDFRRNNPISLSRKEDDFFFVLQKPFLSLWNISNLIMEKGLVRVLRSPSNIGEGSLLALCPLCCLHNQTPAAAAHVAEMRHDSGGLAEASSKLPTLETEFPQDYRLPFNILATTTGGSKK